MSRLQSPIQGIFGFLLKRKILPVCTALSSTSFIMPTSSYFPDIEIPNVDLWGLMFESERAEQFPSDQGTLQCDIVIGTF